MILFDDYINRPHYHFVEKYVSRFKECGRQCMFVVPSKTEIDMIELDRDIISFRNVMDWNLSIAITVRHWFDWDPINPLEFDFFDGKGFFVSTR